MAISLAALLKLSTPLSSARVVEKTQHPLLGFSSSCSSIFARVPFSQFSLVLKPTKTAATLVPITRAQMSSPDYIPDAKFYKVEAIVRPWCVPKISSALLKVGIRGVTIYDVRGFGAQGGMSERQAGSEFSEDSLVGKIKMEIVVSKDQVEEVIDQIIGEARTGEIGDGKIFVVPVADVIRIRTGERGEEAEKMKGGRSDMRSAVAFG